MAIVFICYTAVFLIACVAACSLANSYETLQRQKSAKSHSVIVPTTILIGVFISAIADIVRLVWFSSIETFAEDFIRAFYGTGISIAVFLILTDAISTVNSKYLVKQVVTDGTTTAVGRYASFDSAFSKASQIVKENRRSTIIIEDLSGNELATISTTARTRHSQNK